MADRRSALGVLVFLIFCSASASASECAGKAEYYGPPPPNNRDTVRISAIMGGFFKIIGAVNDVESKGVGEDGTETQAKPAKSIITSSGLQYEVSLQHRANYDRTLVRIQCGDGTWSGWLIAQK
jgi:hypothetical protein